MSPYIKKSLSFYVLAYLRFFAKLKLLHLRPKTIGVTGSVGKTSAIKALHTVISPDFKTKTTFKGNSESGIPLEILGIKMKNYSVWSWLKAMVTAPFYAIGPASGGPLQILIVEMGVDAPTEPKNMSYLLKILKPDIGIVLNVEPVHTEQFNGDIEKIAAEKGLLVTSMSENKTAIVNGDNPYLQKIIPQIKAKTLLFGFAKNSNYNLEISNYNSSDFHTTFEFTCGHEKHILQFENKLFFKEYGFVFAAAILAARELGIEINAALKRLEKYSLPPGRLTPLSGEKNSTIIDSSYNSSPAACLAVLGLIKNMVVKGNKILVLGDMRELGVLAKVEHERIVKEAAKIGDYIILIGPQMKKYGFQTLLDHGFPANRLFWFEKSKGAGEFINNQILQENDLILVKGSQNLIFLEEIMFELMLEKEKAHEVLCRQSEYWQKVRADFFAS